MIAYKSWLAIAILASAVLLVTTWASRPVRAAGPWYVGPGGSDSKTCLSPAARCATINGALNKAGFVAGDSIRVATGTYTGTGSEVVLLDKNATLSGGWDASFAAQIGTSTLDGQGARRGITVGGDVTAIVERFAVQNGAGYGAGIFNNGIVTVNNSTVSSNKAYNGGGIYNYRTLTLNNSAVSGNTADDLGGGIYSSQGIVTLNNSTISDNIADGSGGGIYSNYSTVTLNNSTISNNAAGIGTEWWHYGGGIHSFGDHVVVLQNTVLAENKAYFGADCYKETAWSTISSAGYNLFGEISSCAISLTTGDLTNVDPKLGPLEGSPGYHPLLSGSLAINAGNPAGCMGSVGLLTTDQRGAPRVGRCDIGAYEAGLIATKQVSGSPGRSLSYKIILNNIEGNVNLTNVSVTDTIPISLTYIPGSFSATSGTGGESGGIITWTGTVPANTDTILSFSVIVSDAVPQCSVITNKAIINQGGSYEFERQVMGATPCVCNLTKHTGNPVLSVGANGTWDDGDVWGPAVLKEGSLFKMWYSGHDGSNPSRIGLATSTNGVNWTKEAANPVLSPSETWEAEGVRAGGVISDGGLYKMWYTGFDSGGVGRIGYATSPDGVTWTKYGSNPVLNVGASGSWEDEDASWPTVIKEGSIYHLWYTGADGVTSRIGHATSSNGTNWTKDPANPVLDIGPPGAWDWLEAYATNVVAYNGYLLWYSGGTLPEAWQTGYALSSDGSDWTRGEKLIPEGPPGSFDAYSADYPSVIVDGAGFKVWYSGQNASGTYNIGYATAEICSEAGPSNLVYLPIVLKGAGAQPACPPYYTDDFSNPDSGWLIDDNSNRRSAYAGGQYQIWLKNPSSSAGVTPGAKATDFAVAVNARRASGSQGSYGIIFGINEDWSQFYEFNVDAQYYSIWKYDHGTWTPLRNWTTSSHIRTGTNWNRLKVIREGANIAVYVNNQHLATVTNGNFTGLRRIGLVAVSPSSGSLDARFDDFSLYPASCGPIAAEVGFEMGEPGVHEAPLRPGWDQSP